MKKFITAAIVATSPMTSTAQAGECAIDHTVIGTVGGGVAGTAIGATAGAVVGAGVAIFTAGIGLLAIPIGAYIVGGIGLKAGAVAGGSIGAVSDAIECAEDDPA